MRISDWSSDVCSSDLFFCNISSHTLGDDAFFGDFVAFLESNRDLSKHLIFEFSQNDYENWDSGAALYLRRLAGLGCSFSLDGVHHLDIDAEVLANRSEEHTSELQSLMRISYAVFCLKKKKSETPTQHTHNLTSISTDRI